jgi:hypothetical protein
MSSADIVSSGSATSAGGGSIFADSATSGSASLSDLTLEFLPDFLSVLSDGLLGLSAGGLALALRLGDNLLSGDFDFARDEVRADGSKLVLAVDCLFEDFVLVLPMPNNGNGINGFPNRTC